MAPTDDGKLQLRPGRGTPVTLVLFMRDAFHNGDLGTITFTRNSDQTVTGLTISTGRVRRLALTMTRPGQ